MKQLETFVSTEHFSAIYEACKSARFPNDLPNIEPADWWRGLLVMAFMTGWRISQLRALRWEDVDLENGTALSRADDNKGKRDTKIPLHPLTIEHLRKLEGSFERYVFAWNQHNRTLWSHFHEIQEAAKLSDGSPLPKGGKNGSRYGLHDLRRGFATANAGKMDLFQLQALMQHKSLETTRMYVNMAGQLDTVVSELEVPDILRKPATG